MQKLLSQLEKIYKYLAVAILIVVPLYPKFPFIRIPGTYVSIRIEDFLMAILALLVLVGVGIKFKSFLKNKIISAIGIFLAVGLISLVSGVFLTKTIPLSLGILHWGRRIEYFMPFFAGLLFINSHNKDEIIEFFIKTLMLVTVLVFIYGIGQRYFNWPVIITQNEEYSKGIALRWVPGSDISSTFAGHYDLATFLVILLPIFTSLFFLIKQKKVQFLLLIVIFSGLWLLVSTISRISIVSYLVGVCLSLALIRKYKAIILVVLVSIIFISLSSDLLARYTRIIEVTYKEIAPRIKILYLLPQVNVYAQDLPQKRLNITPSPTPTPVFEDRSTSIRLDVEWPRAIRAFTKNPLLGTGYSSITLATDNDFLRLLGEVGILGFGAFILIFLRIGLLFKKALPLDSNFKRVDLAFMSGIYGALAGFFINAMFIDVFEASKVAIIFWLLMGIAVSTVKLYDTEQIN